VLSVHVYARARTHTHAHTEQVGVNALDLHSGGIRFKYGLGYLPSCLRFPSPFMHQITNYMKQK